MPPGESVVNQMRMSAVVRDDEGVIRVGLMDQKAKKNYLLAVGETVDGIEIVAADYERAERDENLTLAAPPEPALEQGATWP